MPGYGGGPGKAYHGPYGLIFVGIPAGTFCMGLFRDDGDEKLHQVRITNPFQMGKYEVTQAQWEAVTGNNPSFFKDCPECPVERVSWDDVGAYIAKLNSRNDGYVYRLPTEAEWEYACRAGTTGEYAGFLSNVGWFEDNSGGKTHPVGQKRPNAFWLYDMHGNVWEWCQDFHGPYAAESAVDPAGPASGSKRVHRGGGWGSPAASCRSAHRHSVTPDIRGDFLGLRLVRTRKGR